MNTTKTARNIARLGLAIAATVLAVPTGTATAGHGLGRAEHGVIERQCEVHNGSFFVNTHDGLNLICSAPTFHAAARPARLACERAGGSFRFIGADEPSSWACHVTGTG